MRSNWRVITIVNTKYECHCEGYKRANTICNWRANMRVNAKSIGQSIRESIRRLLERQYESQSEGYWTCSDLMFFVKKTNVFLIFK